VAGGVSIGVAVGLGAGVALGVATGLGVGVADTIGEAWTVAAGDAVGFAVSVLGTAVGLGTTVSAGVLAGTMIGARVVNVTGAGVGVGVVVTVTVAVGVADGALVLLAHAKSTWRSRCWPSAMETVQLLSGALVAVNRTLWFPGGSGVWIGGRPTSLPSTKARASDRSLPMASVP
jgi:hypothetical protein